jgi:hypothetical protein
MPLGSDRQALVNSTAAPALFLMRSSIGRAPFQLYSRLKRFRLESARRHRMLDRALEPSLDCALVRERAMPSASSRAATGVVSGASFFARGRCRGVAISTIAARATCAARDGGVLPCAAGAERRTCPLGSRRRRVCLRVAIRATRRAGGASCDIGVTETQRSSEPTTQSRTVRRDVSHRTRAEPSTPRLPSPAGRRNSACASTGLPHRASTSR